MKPTKRRLTELNGHGCAKVTGLQPAEAFAFMRLSENSGRPPGVKSSVHHTVYFFSGSVSKIYRVG
jgi:hypothetical protein